MKILLCLALAIGLAFTISGQDREKIEQREQAVRLTPNSAQAWYELGVAKFARKGTDNAQAAFEKAIELDPEYADAYLALGSWHLRPKRSCALGALRPRTELDTSAQTAIDYLTNGIRLKPEAPSFAFESLGKAYERLSRYQEAVEAYKKAIDLGPEHLFVHLDLARLYKKASRIEDQIALYRQTILKAKELRRPNTSDSNRYINDFYLGLPVGSAYHDLAELYVQLGRDQEALEIYKEVVELGLDQDYTHFEMGSLFVRMGDKISAQKEQQTLLDRAAKERHKLSRKELKANARTLRERIAAL